MTCPSPVDSPREPPIQVPFLTLLRSIRSVKSWLVGADRRGSDALVEALDDGGHLMDRVADGAGGCAEQLGERLHLGFPPAVDHGDEQAVDTPARASALSVQSR